MIKTPLSTVLGGAFWTPGCTVVGSTPNLDRQIAKLFSNGEQGFYYDPNDLNTMFQDAAGAIPVTDVGQPVGLIRDKSGRNNHAFQTNSASRPILRKNAVTGAYYLEFDGLDDFYVTNSINFTTTNKVALLTAARKVRESVQFECLLNFGASATNGSFALMLSSAFTSSSFENRGTLARYAVSAPYTAPKSQVLTGIGDLQENKTILRTSGLQTAVDTSLGSGNYSNSQLFIGRRDGASQSARLDMYGLIGVSRLTTDNEIAAIEKELAKRIGVTLNV